jgi:hypothetical protein
LTDNTKKLDGIMLLKLYMELKILDNNEFTKEEIDKKGTRNRERIR